jgi:hypothetical protein
MGFLLVVVFLALSGWSIISLFRRLHRQHVGASWWVVLAVLVASGTALGVWCALYCEYQIGTRFRIASFPIPGVFFHFEDGQWVDFPVSEFQAHATVFTNVVTMIALTTSPLWLLLSRQRRHGSTQSRELA